MTENKHKLIVCEEAPNGIVRKIISQESYGILSREEIQEYYDFFYRGFHEHQFKLETVAKHLKSLSEKLGTKLDKYYREEDHD